MNGFKKFLLRGNVVDMAVGVVVGVAFNNVVAALVKDLITPLISAVGGTPNFVALNFKLGRGTFMVGDFINTLVSFILIAAVVYYLVVLPVNALVARLNPPAPPDHKKCPECAQEIPLAARRCPFCTSSLAA